MNQSRKHGRIIAGILGSCAAISALAFGLAGTGSFTLDVLLWLTALAGLWILILSLRPALLSRLQFFKRKSQV